MAPLSPTTRYRMLRDRYLYALPREPIRVCEEICDRVFYYQEDHDAPPAAFLLAR